jgi:hypothetical protein
MRTLLAPAHLALTIIILIWDIVLAGRIAQNGQAPKTFQALSGLAALLVLPGLLFNLATSTIITGRAVVTMDWVWPAVLVLFALQATYALFKRLVNPLWGIPIMAYDVLIAAIGVVRFLVAHGYAMPESLVSLIAAQSLAMVFANGNNAAVLATPLFLNMPLVSPAFPALRRLTASFRGLMTIYAVLWGVLILLLGEPRAVTQLRNYEAHRRDQLRERPNGDFAIGLKMLPDVKNPPPPPAIRSDSALADTLELDAFAIVVSPNVTRLALDSLAKVVGPDRRGDAILIVAIGYPGSVLPLRKTPLNEPERLATLKRVIERLHPNIVLPAEDPYASGERAVGNLTPVQWQTYLINAARVAKAADPKVRVGVAASLYTTRDSILYAWAASPGSPIDVVGFSLFPSPFVGGGIQSDVRTADRWLRVTPPKKDHWVFATGGFPLAYGESSQYNAIWEVLSWATDHPAIKGAIVYEAGDYGQTRGLRAPNGRLRPAATGVMRAIRMLRESAR